MISATSRIRKLVLEKLAGRNIDVIGCLDGLLDLAQEVGAMRCTLAAENSLRFDMFNLDSCDVELDACRGKLRMLCARLHVLCDTARGLKVSPYGGEGTIQKTLQSPQGNGSSTNELRQWTVRFKNTTAEQEFTVTPVRNQLDSSALALGIPAVTGVTK